VSIQKLWYDDSFPSDQCASQFEQFSPCDSFSGVHSEVEELSSFSFLYQDNVATQLVSTSPDSHSFFQPPENTTPLSTFPDLWVPDYTPWCETRPSETTTANCIPPYVDQNTGRDALVAKPSLEIPRRTLQCSTIDMETVHHRYDIYSNLYSQHSLICVNVELPVAFRSLPSQPFPKSFQVHQRKMELRQATESCKCLRVQSVHQHSPNPTC
jgi:hypothetical protein